MLSLPFTYLQILVLEHGIVRYEYMGAAEYEWGSIPMAWCWLGRALRDGTALTGVTAVSGTTSQFGRPPVPYELEVSWIALPTYDYEQTRTPMEELIRGIAAGTLPTKESPRFQTLVAEPDRHYIGWLSVDGKWSDRPSKTPQRPIFVAVVGEQALELVRAKALSRADYDPGLKAVP